MSKKPRKWINSNKSIRFVCKLLTSSNGFLNKIIKLENRNFSLRTQNFENGYFVSVSEDNDKIGSMTVSLATGSTPTTTTIIPSRNE